MKQPLKNYLLQTNALSDEEISHALSLFEPIKLKKEEFFVEENKVCNQVAFILEGGVRAFSTNAHGEENVVCFSFENRFITSFESFFSKQPSKKSIQAIEDCTLLVIHYDKLHNLLIRNPSWQIVSKALTEQEFIEKENYLLQFNNRSAKEKYLKLLTNNPEIIRRTKVEHLASYLGVTQRTLTRVKREIMLPAF